jgi:hypothetical protein
MRRRTVVGLSVVCAAALAVVAAAGSANAVPVFADGFDAEAGTGDGTSGGSGVGYTGFANWTVSNGTVDLVAQGDFGIDCYGLSGKCVDLDGNTLDAGVLTSILIHLDPGTYSFEFQLAGVDAGFGGAAAAAPNVVDVSVGSFFSDTITRNQGDPFASYGGTFTVTTATDVQIVFANQGGDQFGAVLDAVRLDLVPEPATGALLAFGLGGLAAVGRSRLQRGGRG